MDKKVYSWIHLSDIHLYAEADTEILIEDCKKLSEHISPDFMIITGDFRQLNKDNTYKKALGFLPEILKIFNVEKRDVYIVPGNHDISISMQRNYKMLRTKNIKKIIAELEKSPGDYNKYSEYYHEGNAPLVEAFGEYCDFVKSFYKDAGIEKNDMRVTNPAEVFCSVWRNKINIVHVNTAIISDGNNGHKQMCDVSGLFSCKVDQKLPTIMIGHHNIKDLYESQAIRILNFAKRYNVSAYFSGDIHLFDSCNKELDKPYQILPCISCPKSVPQSGDSYSEIGLMYYTWKVGGENKVEINAFKWSNGGYKPNPDYIYDIDKKDYFVMKCNSANLNISSVGDVTLEKEKMLSEPDAFLNGNKYIDSFALSIYKKKLGYTIASAILQQADQDKCEIQSIELIRDYIMESPYSCPLLVKGAPGTGKSTFLSVLYLMLREECKYWTYYIDLHYYDKTNDDETKRQLLSEYKYIDENIKTNSKSKILLFVDGLNEYVRLKPRREMELRKKMAFWQTRDNVQIICAVGSLGNNHYPPFTRLHYDTTITAQRTIYLSPIETSSRKFRDMTDKILYCKGIYEKDHKRLTKPQQNALCTKIIDYSRLIDGDISSFQIPFFLSERYITLQDELFKKPVALLLKDYFLSMMSERQLVKISDEAADFLQHEEKDNKLNRYLIKGDEFLDFFFAYSYVNYLKSSSSKTLKDEEFSKYDCIFTARINRFVVQLICSNKETEKQVLTFANNNFANMPVKAKNQVVYILGRFSDEGNKKASEKFLFALFNENLKCYSGSEKSNSEVMILRSIGISLLKLGCILHENDFYELLIFDERMSKINRLFHISYYLQDSYKLTDDDVLDNNFIYSERNIKKTYNLLYHSITNAENINHRYVNIITIIDLVLNFICRSSLEKSDLNTNKSFRNFKALMDSLSEDNNLINPVVKSYVKNIVSYLDCDDPYKVAFEQVYNMKDQLRKGWVDRKIHIKRRTESVSDHIWACCMLAQMLLPENIHDSDLIDKEECSPHTNYNKQKVISLLLVHDFPETITGDISTKDKTTKDYDDEKNAITVIGTLSAFPSLSPMRSVFKLWQEFNCNNNDESINARLAFDIDKLEPIIQLYFYKQYLEVENDYSIAEKWLSGLELKTNFGRNLLKFIKAHFINHEEFEK